MKKILDHISNFVGKHPYSVLIIYVLLALLSVQYTINNIKFLTNRNDLISPDAKYFRNNNAYRKEFKNFDKLLIAVEGSKNQKVIDFVEDLAHFLNSNPKNFQDVFYKIDTEFFKNKKLLFLSLNELHTLENNIKSNLPIISSLIERPGLVPFFSSVNKEISKVMVGSLITDFFGGDEESKENESESSLDLSLIISILEQMTQYLKKEKNFSSPWQDIFVKKEGEIDEDGYLTSSGNKFYFIFVSPAQNKTDFAKAVVPIKMVRSHIKKLQEKFPGVKAGVTGPTALSSDEMITAKSDTVKASIISLIGVSLILVAGLKGLKFPFISIFTLVIALCLSAGCATLTIGHLNILSVVFTTILIGLGIDFSIHLILRYQEEVATGKSLMASLNESLAGTGKGIIAGAITTSFAFFATIFTNFRGIAELGIIAGAGIIICMTTSFTLLPAMILINDRKKNKDRTLGKRPNNTLTFDSNHSARIARPFLNALLMKPWLLIFISLFITFLAFSTITNVRFDYNILNLQAPGTESVDYEMKIINSSDRSAWYGVVIVDRFDDVLSAKKDLELLPSVSSVSSIASIVPDRQKVKIKMIQKISPYLNDFPKESASADPVNLKRLTQTLKKIHFKLRKEDTDNWKPGTKPQTESILRVKSLIKDFNHLIQQNNAKTVERDLNQYQKILFQDFAKKLHSFRDALDPAEIKIKDIPQKLKERFIGKTGKFLLNIFPKVSIYDREPMEKFISDIWSIDPNATGIGVTASESSRLMKEGYIIGGIYALIAIIIFVWILFRDWRALLLVILPLTLGSIWTLGLMGLFNLPFNLANLIILPLIIGIGIDNGIHMVHRYREDQDNIISPVFKSTGKAVFLSSLTTIVGFGSLAVASHRGIHSIGVLLTLGIGCCMIASLTVLPAILMIVQKREWGAKKKNI